VAASNIYVLAIDSVGMVARIGLNGVEIFADPLGEPRVFQTKLNQWLVDGDNRIQLELQPVVDDDGRIVVGDRAFAVELVRGVHGRVPGPEGILLSYRWSAEEEPIDPSAEIPTWRWTRPFMAADSFGRWSWQDAAPAPMTLEARAAIVAKVEAVHAALVQRDQAALSRLFRPKNEELARAFDLPLDELEADQAEHFRSCFGSTSWAMEPFDPDAIDLVPMADGRLVRAEGLGGRPPLRGTSGDGPFVCGMTLTRVGADWIIVR
jgi:hypothetical protein